MAVLFLNDPDSGAFDCVTLAAGHGVPLRALVAISSALFAGTLLAGHAFMRVLEARFHPWKKAKGPFVVVGRVLCRHRRSVVEPAATGLEEQPTPPQDTMLDKLEYLVGREGRDAFHRLQELPSEFWSFVEVKEGESD